MGRPATIFNYLNLKPGKKIDLRCLEKSKNLLMSMGVYESIELKEKKHKIIRKQTINTDIEFNVIETNSRETISQLLTTRENFGRGIKIIFTEKNFLGLHQTLVLSS